MIGIIAVAHKGAHGVCSIPGGHDFCLTAGEWQGTLDFSLRTSIHPRLIWFALLTCFHSL